MAIEFHHIVPNTVCSECKASEFPIDSIYLRRYFFSEAIVCSKCGHKLDWWSVLYQHAEFKVPFNLFGLVGAISTIFTVQMKPNEVSKIDLSEVQIPKDAQILFINYTANGEGVWPIEIHSNSPIRHFIPHTINLFGRPTQKSTVSTPIAVFVVWVNTSFTEESWLNLVQAFSAYSNDMFASAIIPANVAIESRLIRVLNDYIGKFASKEKVEEFLEGRATYSYQLNVLLPLITHLTNFPKLPDHIRGFLNKLRDHRNDLAHKGKLDSDIDKSLCAKLLCASVFGFGYVELLEEHLKHAIE